MLTWSLVYLALSLGAGLDQTLTLFPGSDKAGSIMCICFGLLALCHFLNWLQRLRLGATSLRDWASWQPVPVQAN